MFQTPIVRGNTENGLEIISLTLAAGASDVFHYNYSFFRVLKDTAGGARFILGENARETKVPAGLGFNLGIAVPQIKIRNAAASSSDIVIALGIGDIVDNRVYNSDTLFTLSSPFNNITGVPDVTLVANTITPITAATGAGQQDYVITHKGSSDIVYLGGSDVSAARGIPLEPGDSITMSFDGIIYAFSTGTPTVGGVRLYRS